MNIINIIQKKINNYIKKIHIVFPEGKSEKIQKVALMLQNNKIIIPILIFEKKNNIPQNIIDNKINYLIIEEQNTEKMAQFLLNIRKNKINISEARQLVKQTNYFSVMLIKMGKAEGMVGGILYNSKDIILPALQIIKSKINYKLVSSFFLMIRKKNKYIFTDCALNIDPTAEELANIAILGYKASKMFNFKKPNISLLSYSTKNSGHGLSVDKVKQAYQIILSKKLPNCRIEGEFQFDAAWSNKIRNKKAPNSVIKSKTDIYVFPNLDSGNIGYKIAQYLGKFKAIGPILIGLNNPINDISRGASIKDIYDVVIITAYIFIYENNKKKKNNDINY